MSFFEESQWQPTNRPSAQQVAYLREVLAAHANDPTNGMCPVCRVTACPDWRAAYDQLAVAGELMAEPEQWMAHGNTAKGLR